MLFKDKVVVITGGANGIGLCIADEFKKQGAKIIVIDIDEKGYDCDLFFKGDIANEEVLIEFSEKIKKSFKVDFLINNACDSRQGLFSDCSYEDFLYVQKVGVVAPFMLTKLLLNAFNENGAIINISSTRQAMSQPNTESYSAAKGGISALTHSMAISLAGKIRVNSISPGWIDTKNSNFPAEDKNQHPVKRVGAPIDIANMVLFLCSEKSSFINGENIIIDGGMTKQMIYHGDWGWNFKQDEI